MAMAAGGEISGGIVYEAAPKATFASRFRENVVKGGLTDLELPGREFARWHGRSHDGVLRGRLCVIILAYPPLGNHGFYIISKC